MDAAYQLSCMFTLIDFYLKAIVITMGISLLWRERMGGRPQDDVIYLRDC